MWLVFALLSAVTKGFGNFFNKLGADRVDSVVLTWLARVIGIVFAATAYLVFDDSDSSFTGQFFLALLVAGGLTTMTSIIRFNAFREGEVSHLIPLGNLTPVLTTLFAIFLINETPSWLGVVGIMVVTIGAYVLHIQSSHLKWYEPFQDIYRLPPSRKMLLVVIMLSISINFDRIGLRDVSPYIWVLSIGAVQAIATTPKAVTKMNEVRSALKQHWLLIIGLSAFSIGAFLFQMLSFAAGSLIGYTIAIKRLDSIVTILLAGYFLKENDIRKRLLGGGIMAIGAIVIALS